jgi:hypothetical protein
VAYLLSLNTEVSVLERPLSAAPGSATNTLVAPAPALESSNAPAGTTNAPAGTTNAPAGTTNAPAGTTNSPAGATNSPTS